MNRVQEIARVSHPGHTYRAFFSSFPWGERFFTPLGSLKWCQLALRLIGLGISPGGPGDVRLCATSVEAAGTDWVPRPLAVGLSFSLGLFRAAGWASKCTLAVVPTLASFSLLGALNSGAVLRDEFTSLPALHSWEATLLVVTGAGNPPQHSLLQWVVLPPPRHMPHHPQRRSVAGRLSRHVRTWKRCV
jgi:hypothetical protein